MNDIVSVVIPIYNNEKYIGDCINSILNQDYDNLDIIIVDDGSTDQSAKICQDFAKVDKRIKYVQQNNSGVSSARNRGIDEAMGDYIVFIDSDDTIEKRYISKMVNCLKANLVDLVICNYHILYANDGVIKENCTCQSKLVNVQNFFYNYWDNYHFGYVNAPWNKLYKMSLIKQFNLKFPPHISMGEDGYFNVNYLYKCKNVFLLDDYLYNFKIHSEQSTNKIFKNHFHMLREIFDNLEDKLSQYGFMEDNKYLKRHYQEYFNELKLSLIYLFKDKTISYKDKRNELNILCKDVRTMTMITYLNATNIKDKSLLFFIKHHFFLKEV